MIENEEPMSRLLDIGSDITMVAQELKGKRKRVAFLERVLAQAVLTHGGMLTIDPHQCNEAILELETRSLVFGDGAVRLEDVK